MTREVLSTTTPNRHTGLSVSREAIKTKENQQFGEGHRRGRDERHRRGRKTGGGPQGRSTFSRPDEETLPLPDPGSGSWYQKGAQKSQEQVAGSHQCRRTQRGLGATERDAPLPEKSVHATGSKQKLTTKQILLQRMSGSDAQ